MYGDDEGLDLEAVRRNQRAREEHFAAIGRFIVAFSQLEFTYKHFLADAIQLSDEDFNPVMSAFDFSKLCNITRVMFKARWGEENAKKLDDLIARSFRINDARVKIVHGLWTYTDDGLNLEHVGRNAVYSDNYYSTIVELDKLTDETSELNRLLSRRIGTW